MNIVDKVTTIGCMRRIATKKPLNAPDSTPIPTPAARMINGDIDGVLQRRGQCHVDERDHRAGREIETAGEYDDGLAHRRQGERGAARRHRREVVVAQTHGAEARHRCEQHEEDGDGDDEPALPREALIARRRDGFCEAAMRRSPLSRRPPGLGIRTERRAQNLLFRQAVRRNLRDDPAAVEDEHAIAEVDEFGDSVE